MAPKIVDLEQMVMEWAWAAFLKTRSKEHDKLTFDDVSFEVNWDRTRFMAGKPEYSDEQTLDRPNSQVVFKSVYENKTGSEQEHAFQTERTTVSSCTTNLTKGFTKGIHLELKLGLPDDIMAATAGFGREVMMERSEQNSHEEMVTWTINSTIKVQPKHCTIAELVVKEQQYKASFKMAARIKGHVVAVLTNRKHNNDFLKCIEGEFAEMVQSLGERYAKHFRVDKDGRTVIWEVSGSCDFRYGIEQVVELSEKALE